MTMETSRKESYTEPVLVKHEQLRDVTAGIGGKYGEKVRDKFTDVPR